MMANHIVLILMELNMYKHLLKEMILFKKKLNLYHSEYI